MKRLMQIALSLSSLTLECSSSSAVILTGPVLNPANGSTYYLLSESTWSESETEAMMLGGRLATIDDAEENSFVLSAFGPIADGLAPSGKVALWIGLNDVAVEGIFVWSSGATLVYTNWIIGQPQGVHNDEDYVGILVRGTVQGGGFPGGWHDIVGDDRFDDRTFGVVELPVSEPHEGDFDFDDDVDGRDFLIWQRGGSPNPLSASDLADWQANYGAGPLATSRTVPEPETSWLLILWASFNTQQGRRNSSQESSTC